MAITVSSGAIASATWQAGEATAKSMNLAQITEAIGRQRALIEELLSPCSDADLRAQIEMFGNKASRGSMLVRLCSLITPPIACSCSCIWKPPGAQSFAPSTFGSARTRYHDE